MTRADSQFPDPAGEGSAASPTRFDAPAGLRVPAFLLGAFLVVLLALGFRLPGLDGRPLHNDEAVNAILLQGLWERGEYRYNPDEYHGPSLHYASLPFLGLSGARDFTEVSDRTLRQVTVAAGVGVVLLVLLLRRALGGPATLVAALLLAVSPAMVFYSRYFIHEMLLVCFTLLLLASLRRYWESPRAGWAAAAGLGAGLMVATKETFVLSLAALGIAALAVGLWNRRTAPPEATGRRSWNRRHVIVAVGVAAAVSLALFTSGFSHPRGPLDAVATYLPWLRRAGGHSSHLHPWHFYFTRLFWHWPARSPLWTEAILGILALAGGVAAFTGRGLGTASAGFARFLAVYTVVLAGIYGAIPYKTPWCLLNFLLPMILLAGVGATAVLRGIPNRVGRGLGAAALALGLAHLGWQGWRASHVLENHRAHPYHYAQTVPHVRELADRVLGIARVGDPGLQTRISVVAPESEYWPLPWYLRSLPNVWWADRLPEPPYPPILVVAAGLRAGLDDKTQRRILNVGYYELRPREFFELYVEYELWKRFVETLPRPKDDE